MKSAWVQRLGVPRWRYRLWKPWGDEAISVGYRWKALNHSKCEYQKPAYKIPLNFIYRSQFYFIYLIWCRGFLQVMKFKMVYKNLKYMSYSAFDITTILLFLFKIFNFLQPSAAEAFVTYLSDCDAEGFVISHINI